MPQFPRRETDVVVLADAMIAGYTVNPTIFPSADTAAAVRSYLVERRDQPAGGGEFGPWNQVATALASEITINDQLRGIQMEYHVLAINTGGQSLPSNIAAVVL